MNTHRGSRAKKITLPALRDYCDNTLCASGLSFAFVQLQRLILSADSIKLVSSGQLPDLTDRIKQLNHDLTEIDRVDDSVARKTVNDRLKKAAALEAKDDEIRSKLEEDVIESEISQ